MLTEDEALQRLRHQIEAEGTQRAWADQAGVSETVVSETLKGRRPLGRSVLRRLQLRPIRAYVDETRPEA